MAKSASLFFTSVFPSVLGLRCIKMKWAIYFPSMEEIPQSKSVIINCNHLLVALEK